MKQIRKIATICVVLSCFALTSYSQDNPKATYRVGNSKVTVWETEKEGKYGKFTVQNYKVEKAYKVGEEWKSTNSFNLTELLQLRAAIDKAINEQGVKEGKRE